MNAMSTPAVTTSQVTMNVHGLMVTKVMAMMAIALISMNVLLVLMLVTVMVHALIPPDHTTALVMMDFWVMDSCALFHVLHSTTLPKIGC